MIWKIPSIEQIYNEYHKQTFFVEHKFYPKTVKSFKVLQNPAKVEYLKRFQQMIKRNRQALDWKLYIKAIAEVMNTRFDLKLLGTLAGTRIYRSYVKSLYMNKENQNQIYNEIIKSLTFLTSYLKENEITFNQYFNIDQNIIPLSLKHIYAGTISVYFYACINETKLYQLMNYSNDVFLEYFQMSKDEFFKNHILNKRQYIMKYPKIMSIIQKLEIILK